MQNMKKAMETVKKGFRSELGYMELERRGAELLFQVLT